MTGACSQNGRPELGRQVHQHLSACNDVAFVPNVTCLSCFTMGFGFVHLLMHGVAATSLARAVLLGEKVQWHAVLCCAVLCCAVLCCAVLCCAVLCCAVGPLLHIA